MTLLRGIQVKFYKSHVKDGSLMPGNHGKFKFQKHMNLFLVSLQLLWGWGWHPLSYQGPVCWLFKKGPRLISNNCLLLETSGVYIAQTVRIFHSSVTSQTKDISVKWQRKQEQPELCRFLSWRSYMRHSTVKWTGTVHFLLEASCKFHKVFTRGTCWLEFISEVLTSSIQGQMINPVSGNCPFD